MTFSIIIPSYKRRYLDEAINSVISQTCDDWELIVVNDCSPEDIDTVVNPYLNNSKIKYHINNYHFGAERLCENWNSCLKYCTGDYIICMGDDDKLAPCCLEEYKKMINKYPKVEILHGQTDIIDEHGEVCELLEPRYEYETALQLIYYRWAGLGRQQFIGDFCYKREPLVKRGGFYSLPFAWGSDDISAVMAATAAGIANTEKICFMYRKNRFSISSDTNNKRKAYALILQWEWYKTFFNAYRIGAPQDMLTIDLLKEMMPLHFRFKINDTICKDLRVGRCNVLYWLRNRKFYNVTVKDILIQLVKSLKR